MEDKENRLQKDKTRSDRPSGRQASEMPEHDDKEGRAPSTLHQGNGPEFQTQAKNLKEKNKGLDNKLMGNEKTDPSKRPDTIDESSIKKEK
jgi:hypothetical protein